MNKQWITYSLFLLSAVSSSIYAKIGCMDNSLHLKEAYDTKAYHYVQCDCPCRVITPKRNKCLYCKHAHDAQLFTLVKPDTTSEAQKIPLFEDSHTIIKRLVQKQIKMRITRP